MMAADPLLAVRDLTKRFAGICAMDGVSFTVGRGRGHAIATAFQLGYLSVGRKDVL